MSTIGSDEAQARNSKRIDAVSHVAAELPLALTSSLDRRRS
jgi:hypothetical protein